MASTTSKFGILLDLAKQTSSEKRRELLREITRLLACHADLRSAENCAAFDDIAASVIKDLKPEARAEISRMIATAPMKVGRTARLLAADEIAVAGPMLEHSIALADSDLIAIASSKSQEHLLAVAQRGSLGEPVSEALVAHGEDQVVATLLVNKGAQIGRETYESLAERAQQNVILHEPFVRRPGVPLDLLNELYTSVAIELRQEILEAYEYVQPAELDAALERSRERVAKAGGDVPEDFEAARLELRKLERVDYVQPYLLQDLVREGAQSRTLFLLALAQLTACDFHFVQRLVEARDIDTLALLCRAAGFDRALFVTLSRHIQAHEGGRAKLDEFGKLYENLSVDVAQRAVRFWKVRDAA